MSQLIFDFDGTIADSFWLAVEIFKHLAKGKHPTDAAEIERLRRLSAREIAKRLGLRWWQIPRLAAKGRVLFGERMQEVQPIAGIVPVLKELHRQGHQLAVVSTNGTHNIAQFLQTNGIRDCFGEIHGDIGLFAKPKTIKKIARAASVPQDCYYIGDEVRDIEAARKARVPCISVAWGYNHLVALQRCHPEVLLRQPEELREFFAQKNQSQS